MTSLPAALTGPQWPRSLVRQLRRGRELVGEGVPAGVQEVGAELFATRLRGVDRLLGGGISRGQTVELVGSRSSGRFSLVVLDLGLAPVPGGRGKESAWPRLRRAAQDHQAGLLIASPCRAGSPAEVLRRAG